MDRQEIINRISYFRTQANLSQRALSLDIFMNESYINKLECSKDCMPSLDTLLKIIEACGTTPEEFFYADLAHYKRDKEFIAKIQGVPDDRIDALIRLL